MAFEVVIASGFKRELKHIAKKHRQILADVKILIGQLAENPKKGSDLGRTYIKSVCQ